MKNYLMALMGIAERWQAHYKRTPAGVVTKLKEEIAEFEEAETTIDRLDECGDVLLLAMRLIAVLTPIEREFAFRVAKMKADRRLPDPTKLKDKVAERKEMMIIARELGLL